MKIDNKTVLITGGGSGIGLAIATKMTQAGAKVIICGRNGEKLNQAKAKVPSLLVEVCDVTDSAQITNLVQKMNAEHNGIDILINNAGIFQSTDYTLADQSIEGQAREVDINFMGPIRSVHHFLPGLKSKPEAAIVNVSSGLAFVPLTLAPVYSATKAGLHAWTRSLRYQLENSNIKVFELMPPLVNTEMVSDFKGAKMMAPEVLASNFIKGLKADNYEITPGQSSQLKMMSKLAPNFIFKAVNKQFA